MLYSFIAEFTRQMKTVRMLILRPIILSVVESVPSLPLKAICFRTPINRLGKSISPGWPSKFYLNRKKKETDAINQKPASFKIEVSTQEEKLGHYFLLVYSNWINLLFVALRNSDLSSLFA